MPSDKTAAKKPRERWTPEEHELFLEGLKKYHRDWRAVERHIGTKTAVQIRSHAQKFFAKAEKEPGTVDFALPPPRPKRKPGAAAAAAAAAASGPSAGMQMGLLQPGLSHTHAGAPHTLFPSLLPHAPGTIYPTAAMSTGTTCNTLPLSSMMAPAADSAAAAAVAFTSPPMAPPSMLPPRLQQPDPAAVASAAAASAAAVAPAAAAVAAIPSTPMVPPLVDPLEPASDDVLNKIAAAAVAAASTVAHAVIAAAGPQYVHVIQQLAHQDERLRFLTCPISELMSNVTTNTAVAPPQTCSLSPSVRGAKDAGDGAHAGSNDPGSSGMASNSGGPTGRPAAMGRLESGVCLAPPGAPAQAAPAPAATVGAPAAAAPAAHAGGAWASLTRAPHSGVPLMNQMLGLPASNEALPSIHTSDFLANPDMALPSLGLSGTLADSTVAAAAGKLSRSLGTNAKAPEGGSDPSNALGDRAAAPDGNALFRSVPVNSGAMAQAQMHAHQLETEGSQGYGEQGSGGDGSRDHASADGGIARGTSTGRNGSGGSGQPGSGGSGSKSGKQSGNRPAPVGAPVAPAPPSPFQLPEGSVKPTSGANAEEYSRFYQQYYAEMIRRGTEGLRSIQHSLPYKVPAMPDFGPLPGATQGAAALPSPAGKPAGGNVDGDRQVGCKATAEGSQSPRRKRQRVGSDAEAIKGEANPTSACGPTALGSIRARVSQSEWPMESEVEQHDTATSGQNGLHVERAQREVSHHCTSFSGPKGGRATAAANGSDSGSNQPTRGGSVGGTTAQGVDSREGSHRGGVARAEGAADAVAAQ